MLVLAVRGVVPLLIVCLLALGGAYLPPMEAVAEPDVFFVGEGGYERISDAISVAGPGDIVRVGPGVYTEEVTIDKPIILAGSGIQTIYTSTLIVAANGVTVSGHTFQNIYDNSTIHDWDFGGIVTRQGAGTGPPNNNWVNGLTVSSCTFINCRQGVFLFGAKLSTVDNCNFYGCYRGITIRGHFIGTSEVWTSYSNTIKNCYFYNQKGTGIYDGEAVAIWDSDNNVIDSCTMDRNSCGVGVMGGTGNQIKGCTITNSTYNPLYIDGVTGANSLSVTNNVMRNNSWNVWMNNSNGITFSGNTIAGTALPVDLCDSTSITFNGNSINGSSVYLNESKSCSFASNVFETSDEPAFLFKEGLTKDFYDHTISTSNTIGGRAIHHDHDNNNYQLDGADAGAIYLTYCNDPVVTDTDVTDGDGIWMYNSPGFDIEANVTNCLAGITIKDSDDGHLDGCNVVTGSRGAQGIRVAGPSGAGICTDTAINSTGTGPAFLLEDGSDLTTYNCTFDYDDVNATNGRLDVYNYLNVKVWDNGSIVPLDSVEVEVTRDDAPVYATPHFGGSDAVTDANGEVSGLVLLDREYVNSNTATRHVHNVTVHMEIDAAWTDWANDIDMSGPLTLVFEAADIRAPMIPFGFLVTDVPAEDAINVSWSPNADDTRVYSVYTNMTGDWTLLENVTDNERWLRTGLVHGTEYWFAVSAWDEVPLESPWSAVLSVVHADGLAPEAPSGLVALDVGGTNVTLSWDTHLEPDVEGYYVYVETATDVWTMVAGPMTDTTLTIEDLDSETTYRYAVTAFDEVPNESPRSLVLEITTLDITPPDPPVLDPFPRYTNEDPYTVTGTTEPGATITILIGGSQRATGVADEQGRFSIEVDLDVGLNLVTAWATDEAGNTGLPSAELRVTLDQDPPDAPLLDELPALTNVVEVTVTGTAEPLATISVSAGGVRILFLKTGSDGAFTVTFDLVEGENVITAFATDEALNEGPVTRVVVVLDTIAPDAPLLDAIAEYTNVEVLTLSGTAEPGSHVLVTLGGTVVAETDADGEGAWSVDVTLSPGENVLRGRARDLAGNTGVDSEARTIVLDLVDPVADAGDDIEETEGIEVTFDGSDSTDEYGIVSYEWTFTWNGQEVTLQGETPSYTFDAIATVTVTLEVTDPAGNTGTDTVTVNVLSSNRPPTLRLGTLDPSKGTVDTDFTFEVIFTDPDGDDGEVWVWIDGNPYLMTPDPDDADTTDGRKYTFTTKLGKGEHPYYFTGKDDGGLDAGGPSAGEDNAASSPDVNKRKTEETPGPVAVVAILALLLSLVLVAARRRS